MGFYLQNYTAIVDYDKRSCYIMKLDRVKVTPPKDWIDLIQKFAVSSLSQAPLTPIPVLNYKYYIYNSTSLLWKYAKKLWKNMN